MWKRDVYKFNFQGFSFSLITYIRPRDFFFFYLKHFSANIAKCFRLSIIWLPFLKGWIRPVLTSDLSVFPRGAIFEWQIVAARSSALVEGVVGMGYTGWKLGGRRVVSLSPQPLFPSRHYVTIRRVALRGDAAAWRGHASGKGSRVAEKVDQYQAKRSAPLPTSVATRATTRPARCSRIDFVNPTWKTATSPLLLINYKSSILEYFLFSLDWK